MAFFNVVLPIFIVMATGFLLQRWRPVDPKALSTVLMYLLGPTLMFSAIIHSSLTSDDVRIMTVFALIFLGVSWLVGGVGARLLRLTRDVSAAVVVSIIIANSANYGGSAALFAWGNEGFQTAIVFMAIHQVFASMLAIYVCARGRQGVSDSVKAILKQPVTYATVSAALLRMSGIDADAIPALILRPIDMLAQANIPIALILLGMTLSGMRLQVKEFTALGFVNLSRLILIPLIMIPIVALLGAEGLVRNVLILQAAMPTAVTSLVYASEFETRPDLVGAAVATSTFLSLITVTIVLHFLGA